MAAVRFVKRNKDAHVTSKSIGRSCRQHRLPGLVSVHIRRLRDSSTHTRINSRLSKSFRAHLIFSSLRFGCDLFRSNRFAWLQRVRQFCQCALKGRVLVDSGQIQTLVLLPLFSCIFLHFSSSFPTAHWVFTMPWDIRDDAHSLLFTVTRMFPLVRSSGQLFFILVFFVSIRCLVAAVAESDHQTHTSGCRRCPMVRVLNRFFPPLLLCSVREALGCRHLFAWKLIVFSYRWKTIDYNRFSIIIENSNRMRMSEFSASTSSWK